jgi:hypothetical protein
MKKHLQFPIQYFEFEAPWVNEWMNEWMRLEKRQLTIAEEFWVRLKLIRIERRLKGDNQWARDGVEYPLHTCWCWPSVNNSYQHGALLEPFQPMRVIGCNPCWYSPFKEGCLRASMELMWIFRDRETINLSHTPPQWLSTWLVQLRRMSNFEHVVQYVRRGVHIHSPSKYRCQFKRSNQNWTCLRSFVSVRIIRSFI